MNSLLEEHSRPGGADDNGARSKEEENAREPHLSVKNGGSSTSEIFTPVTNTREEGDGHYTQGKDEHVQSGMFKMHITGEQCQEQEKDGGRKEAVVEMGGSGVKHEGIVKILAKTRDDPFCRHEAGAARAAIRAEIRGFCAFMNMAA